MTPKPVTRWALLNRSTTRLDGERCHLIFADCLPVLFHTRREARVYAETKYGYIRQRPDLRREPHCCRVPQPVRVTVAIGDTRRMAETGTGSADQRGDAEGGNRPTPGPYRYER